jgi:hypothetical protein
MLQTARIVPLVLFVSVLIAGCSQNDLGRYCFVGAEGGDPFLKILNLEAPECGERLCLKQGGYKCTGESDNCTLESDERAKLQPMCTNECSENGDCEKSDENVNGCRKYVCQRQGPETDTFKDHCICVCLDFIRSESGDPIDAETFNDDPNYNACK